MRQHDCPTRWIIPSDSQGADFPGYFVTIDKDDLEGFTAYDRETNQPDFSRTVTLPHYCDCIHFQTRILPKLRRGLYVVVDTCSHIRRVRQWLLPRANSLYRKLTLERKKSEKCKNPQNPKLSSAVEYLKHGGQSVARKPRKPKRAKKVQSP